MLTSSISPPHPRDTSPFLTCLRGVNILDILLQPQWQSGVGKLLLQYVTKTTDCSCEEFLGQNEIINPRQ
jgi:hypothetical protein